MINVFYNCRVLDLSILVCNDSELYRIVNNDLKCYAIVYDLSDLELLQQKFNYTLDKQYAFFKNTSRFVESEKKDFDNFIKEQIKIRDEGE